MSGMFFWDTSVEVKGQSYKKLPASPDSYAVSL